MTTSTGRSIRWNRMDATALAQRVAKVGFLFFMVKGLLWLAVPVALHQVLVG